MDLEYGQIVDGSFVVDMRTITNIDFKDPGYNQKLVGHLKSDDFFGVEKFPTATFKVTESSKFDVRYGSDSFFDNLGDKAIDDIFTLEIKLAVNEY